MVVACLVVFYPILSNDFLYYWDDQWQVMNQYTEGGFNLNNLRYIFSEFFHGQYSPVNQLMYLIIYCTSGYNPFAFHLTSLLLHAGNACLAYIIIIRIFSQTNRITTNVEEKRISLHSELDSPIHKRTIPIKHVSIAFITALLFAIHPMNVEAVAWISASKILVFAFFYLTATYVWLVYLDRAKILYYIVTLLLFALSFGGKEQAVTFPVWLLMLHWLLGRSFKNRKVWIEVAPFFVMAITFCIITFISHNSSFSNILSSDENYPLWQRFIFGCFSLFEYFAKFIFPYKLLYIYPFPITTGEPVPEWMLLYPVLLIIVIIASWKYLSGKPIAVGLVFFLIHIALVLHIIPLSRFAIIADRYIYMSSIGLSFIIGYYTIWIITSRKRFVRNTVTVLFVSIVLYLGIYSNLRSCEWKDSDSIKKELRELIRQHADFNSVEFEKLKNEENKLSN